LKRLRKLLLLVLVGVLVHSVAMAGKKPADVYIRTVKIEVIAERYDNAMAYLDTLFHYYGPHSEGLNWMGAIIIDLFGKTSDLEQKRVYVEKMVAYADSLHVCCANKEINKKYRKDCDKFIEKTDSTLEFYWRTLYNDGVTQVNQIQKAAKDLEAVSDSTEREFFQELLAALIDTCLFNMSAAILIDSTDPRPYTGLAAVYEAKGDFPTSNEWLIRGLERATERGQMLLQIGYNHVRLNEYCKAIPYLREFADASPISVENEEQMMLTMSNLSICYNNCQQYDSAAGLYHRILGVDAENTTALTGLGRYHNEMARRASDSANIYKSQADEALTESWQARRDQHFDSSQVYLRRVFQLRPDDPDAAEEYGIVSYIRGRFEDAAEAFARVGELRPDNVENWTSLGDCHISLQQFADAAKAYEKVIELEPDNKQVLEHLVDLYLELGQSEKQEQVEQKLRSLQ